MFKLQISMDRHNSGLKFNYCLRFDPHHFSLPSTFNANGSYVLCTRHVAGFVNAYLQYYLDSDIVCNRDRFIQTIVMHALKS